MLLFHIKHKISLTIFIASLSLNAGECDKKAFNIKINDTVQLNDVLTQLSGMCKFSIVTKDAMAIEQLKKPIYGVNIKNLGLREIFNLLIAENNLDYQYINNVLKISGM